MRPSEMISSNRIERLADLLGQRLFEKSSRPFERRLIVVPNEELKGYLFQYFARHLKVAAGMQIFTLPQSFAELDSEERTKRIPSAIELSIILEGILASSMEEMRSFTDLTDYLKSAEDSSRRLGSLCDQLSRLFGRYGTYGREFLPDWIQEKGWQQWLWKKTFGPETPWTYPVKAFLEPHPSSFQVHVFGFPFLPAIYVSFFQQLGAQFYQFSGCAQFWEDLSSDKEKVWTLRRFNSQGIRAVDVEAWKRFSTDTHPLLANWGKLGREYSKQFDVDTEQCYVEPKGNRLLAAVQKDLLQMQISEHPEVGADRSIQVHSAPTKLREIEVLYQTLCDLMVQQQGICPRDILVLSADITAYAPLIHMVFGSQESQLSYSIHGLHGCGQSDVIQAFKHLCGLAQGNFDVDEILKLFKFRCLTQRWGFSSEEVAIFNRWASQAHIRWEWDAQEAGTWMDGLDRLLFGLAMVVSDDQGGLPVFPCPAVDLTDIDLLEKWIGMLRLIHEDVTFLSEPEPRSIGEWLTFFHHLGDRYLTSTVDTEPFFLQIRQLQRQLAGMEQKCWTYASVQRIFNHLEASSTSTVFAPHLEKVTFGSLGTGLMQSARVVWMLGMDEVSFPRSDLPLSLCQLSKRGGREYIPKKIEEDRYAFLSVLCLAQDHFMMSYERVNAEDNKSQGPSVLIQELTSCLEQHYRIDLKALTVHHPSLPFEETYFAPHFAAAQSFYGPLTPLKSFAPRPLVISQKDEAPVFELKKLSALARNPIRFFLQETLGIYMRFEEAEHEEFVVSPLLKSRVRQRALHGGLEEHLQALKAQGALPSQAFYAVALHQILEESTEVQTHLERHQLDTELLLTIELSLTCKEPVLRSEGNWMVPALKVPLPDGREGRVVGKLDHLSAQGILFDGKDGIADGVKYWPQFLVYHALPLFSAEPVKAALFTKQGKLKRGSLEDPMGALAHYLAYYERSSREFSWLMPDWAEALLCGKEAEFAQRLEQIGEQSSTFTDEYLLWLKRRQALPDPAEVFSSWQEDLHTVFYPMQTLWNLKMREYAEV